MLEKLPTSNHIKLLQLKQFCLLSPSLDLLGDRAIIQLKYSNEKSNSRV